SASGYTSGEVTDAPWSALLLQRSRSARSAVGTISAALPSRAGPVPRAGTDPPLASPRPRGHQTGLAAEPGRVARARLAQTSGWGLTICCAYARVSVARAEPRDPDSSLYVAIARSLEHRPLAAWIAPSWPEGRARSGLFREHPAVFFWPAAALGRLGLARAALLCNLLWYLAMLAALAALGRELPGDEGGFLAGALFLVSPLGLQYLLRFNHEAAWGFATIAGLVCLSGPRLGPWRGAALVGLLALACAMKGALGLLGLALWAAWAWRRR